MIAPAPTVPMMRHYNIDARPTRERTMSSIGEGMVDMHSNPTGDHRVVQLKRAGANLIDMIDQMEIQQAHDVGQPLRATAMQKIADGVALAVQAAALRYPVATIPPAPDQPGGEVEGAPV
jgi:hypothetical protein